MTEGETTPGSPRALQANEMARMLVTNIIHATNEGERYVSTAEIQERLSQDDGLEFAVDLLVELGTLCTSAVGVAAAALVNSEDWQTAIAGQGFHPEFHDRVTQIWSTICAKRVEGETAY